MYSVSNVLQLKWTLKLTSEMGRYNPLPIQSVDPSAKRIFVEIMISISLAIRRAVVDKIKLMSAATCQRRKKNNVSHTHTLHWKGWESKACRALKECGRSGK